VTKRRTDEVDPARARRFAWRTLGPGESIEALEQSPSCDGEGDEPDGGPYGEPEMAADLSQLREELEEGEPDPALEAERERAESEVAELAAGVDRAWALTDGPRQLEATARLLREASAMGMRLVAIHNQHPLQSVRLGRLAVRHFDRLRPPQRQAAANAMLWLDFEHPETVELLVEIARAGARAQRLVCPLSLALEVDEGPLSRRFPEASARLARVLDEGPSWTARTIALEWLASAAGRDALPALRRALRQPHVGVRTLALQVLLGLPPSLDPHGTLRAEDVRFLLEDLIEHPPTEAPATDEDTLYAFANALLAAVGRLRPAGGEAPLLAIAGGECAGFDGSSVGFDPEWALCALAAGYPERAMPLVDEKLASPLSWERYHGADAAIELPPDEARPRLLRAAADGAPHVAELARDLWLDRLGEPCPAPELAGVPLALLDGPPGPDFPSRLGVLRGQSREAREAMMEALLRGAPDREALALLVFALADDTVAERPRRRRLPRDRRAFCRKLIARFGSAAVDGLCALAERYPGPCWGASWHSILAGLVNDKTIRKRDHGRLREAAARALATAADGDHARGPLQLLAALGGPAPGGAEMVERLFAFAGGREEDSPWHYACDLLVRADDPTVDERLLATLEAAWAAGDWTRFERLAIVGLDRAAPAVEALVGRALEEVEAPEAVDAVEQCARWLREHGRLREGWLLRALAEPERLRYTVAARLAEHQASARLRRRLEEHLASTARDGAAAAEAAVALVRVRPAAMAADDPRLRRILARAPLLARARLVDALVIGGAPLKLLRPHLDELLGSVEPAVAMVMEGAISKIWRMRHGDYLRRAQPRVAHPLVRAVVAEYVRPARRPSRYWQDAAG